MAVCGGATTARYDAGLSPSTRQPHDLRSECPARSGPDHRPPRHGRARRPCHRWRRHRRRAVPGLHPAGGRPEQPRTAPRTGCGDRPGQHGHRDRLQDRAGRQHPRRLPDPRLRQQHPGVLDRRRSRRPATRYQKVDTILFSGATSSGCGTASASTGPFYCPTDQLVYLDLDFFDELRTRFGAQGGSLAQGYVLAHEYGHHVQDLLGSLSAGGGGDGRQGGRSGRSSRPTASPASGRTTPPSTGFLEPLTAAQIADALDAAAAVGDDRIQQATQGEVEPRLVDPRLVRPAPALVLDRLPERRSGGLRHVQRRAPSPPRHGGRQSENMTCPVMNRRIVPGMRASRLVSLLLLLQARGQMTAAELARELEVSERTDPSRRRGAERIGRADLCRARPHGGIRLVDGYRTRLTGMTARRGRGAVPGGPARTRRGARARDGRGGRPAQGPRLAATRAAGPCIAPRRALPPRRRANGSGPASRSPTSAALSEAVWEATRIAITYDRRRSGSARESRAAGPRAQGRDLVRRRRGRRTRSARIASSRVVAVEPLGEPIRAPVGIRPGRLLGRIGGRLRARRAPHRGGRAGPSRPARSPRDRRSVTASSPTPSVSTDPDPDGWLRLRLRLDWPDEAPRRLLAAGRWVEVLGAGRGPRQGRRTARAIAARTPPTRLTGVIARRAGLASSRPDGRRCVSRASRSIRTATVPGTSRQPRGRLRRSVRSRSHDPSSDTCQDLSGMPCIPADQPPRSRSAARSSWRAAPRTACAASSSLARCSASRVAGLLGGGVEAGQLEDPPVPEDRQQDLVAVDADVVDAGLRDLGGLAHEARDAGARHLEREDLVDDRPDRGRRLDLERGRRGCRGRRPCAGSRRPRSGP